MPTFNYPNGFDRRHCDLVEEHRINRRRVLFAENLAKLKAIAVRLEVENSEAEKYSQETWALRIQRDDKPCGPDVWIVLRTDFNKDLHERTFVRLRRRNLAPPEKLACGRERSLLFAFLLLHEVGHHKLCHAAPRSSAEYEFQEREADLFAFGQLEGKWQLFSAQRDNSEGFL